jgi:hypothetical protein
VLVTLIEKSKITLILIDSGFNLYNTLFLNHTPCYSILPTAVAVPNAVSQEILSLSSRIASTATDPNPTVSVNIITNEVFALSLPLHNGVEKTTKNSKSGLPLAAEIGIGVGAGLLILICLVLLLWLCSSRRRRNKSIGGDNLPSNQWVASQQHKHSSITTAQTSEAWSPKPTHISQSSAGWAQQQDDFRMQPQRSSLQPMPMAQNAQVNPQLGNPNYTELPGDYSAPVEVDGRQVQTFDYELEAIHPPDDQGYGHERYYGQPYIDNAPSRRNDWI